MNLRDFLLEARIRMARYRLLHSKDHAECRLWSDRMVKLIASRSPARVEAMEKRMGLR